ncbi:hypothetical protein C8Q78DRAFT_1080121 [Trametes maxima]|nr:hypothetical protein C8Q78DRAFT_1080121 [Trametes maxima]
MSFTSSNDDDALAISQMGEARPSSSGLVEHGQVDNHRQKRGHHPSPTLDVLWEDASMPAQPPNTPASPSHLQPPHMHAPHLHPLHPLHVAIPIPERGVTAEARVLWTPVHGHPLVVFSTCALPSGGESPSTPTRPRRTPVRTSRGRSLFSSADDGQDEDGFAGNGSSADSDGTPFANGGRDTLVQPSVSDGSDEDISDADSNGFQVDRARPGQDSSDGSGERSGLEDV